MVSEVILNHPSDATFFFMNVSFKMLEIPPLYRESCADENVLEFCQCFYLTFLPG